MITLTLTQPGMLGRQGACIGRVLVLGITGVYPSTGQEGNDHPKSGGFHEQPLSKNVLSFLIIILFLMIFKSFCPGQNKVTQTQSPTMAPLRPAVWSIEDRACGAQAAL